MSDVETRFHEAWLGMVQPIDGLVVSVPVLVDGQCIDRHSPLLQQKLHDLAPLVGEQRAIADLGAFLSQILQLTPDLFDTGPALPEDLSLYIAEGGQTLRPTMALRKLHTVENEPPSTLLPDESTPQSRAGRAYEMLVWDLPAQLPLDKPETVTGTWDYPPSAKFDRLLRQCRVPIGLLTNREVARLVYAPHGESSGAITFRVDDMATVGGRPILDAFVMLLSANRFFGVDPKHQLPQLLRDSRLRQANVTTELADQVLDALGILLRGLQAASEREERDFLREAEGRDDDHLYGGLLTVLLRLVFLLYAEDRGLLPVENEHYAKHLSVLGLFEQLQQDNGAHPDSMALRFGAWPRLIALFRAVFLGVRHGELRIPARRGELFDPERFPFLEGWPPSGGAPILLAEDRAGVRVPTVDDGTIFEVLARLLRLGGQRLSYRALDVEQIGSVYEALMGYHVVRLDGAAVCLRGQKVWITAGEILTQPPARRAAWLQEAAGLSKSATAKIAADLQSAVDEESVLDLLDGLALRRSARARLGQLVIQPGAERRRTSSHYTPRSLSAPIVRRTLEPLLAAMGGEPSSERLLNLKICDPAMGSGAFLVEACRYLADLVVAAWTREGQLDKVAHAGDDVVNHARRLVAQRCLYGVDKNAFAVSLAKLSIWLVTLAREEPFTFVDHALRHGDSLVGLSLDQIRAFHWAPEKQRELFADEIDRALETALSRRQEILAMASEEGELVTREKEFLLHEADWALDRARLIADLAVGAFFAGDSDKARKSERTRRMGAVTAWLATATDGPPPAELVELQESFRARVPAFHWMLEFPEVFYGERPDPLDEERVNRAAYMDAFVGNPPFMGGSQISGDFGNAYRDWLQSAHSGAHGNADLSAHFFRRADSLLGSHGTIGLIATNTIAQGDTRATALKFLVDEGLVIYDATRSMIWPGDAAVAVSVVHLAKGHVASLPLGRRLDGRRVADINSRLRPKSERSDPSPLAANATLSFMGSKIYGQGFTLTVEERLSLISRNAKNAERIFPYLGGEEVNTSPTQSFDRYVISFGQMSLEEAERWPDLLIVVREKVKPERDQLKDNSDGRHRKENWWQFGRETPALKEAIRGLERCLVTGIVSKHLMFSFQPTDRVFSHRLFVFALAEFGPFALLQSRIHAAWTWLLSSTMKNDLNYSASDCFETFPFPAVGRLPSLNAIGETLYEKRRHYMETNQVGLTILYNLLKDRANVGPEIIELRHLHEEMDRAVLAAYQWDDIPVPPFAAPSTDAEREALTAFEDEVIDRLFALNATRAEEEEIRGAATATGKRSGKKKAAATSQNQLALGGVDDPGPPRKRRKP